METTIAVKHTTLDELDKTREFLRTNKHLLPKNKLPKTRRLCNYYIIEIACKHLRKNGKK